MTTPHKVLLETTIQLHRLAGDPENQKGIENELVGKELYTTTFVFREFLRTVPKDLAYIYHFVIGMPSDTEGRVALSKLEYMLASGKGNFSARSARRERLVTAVLRQAVESNHASRQFLLVLLERTVDRWIRDFFRLLTPGGEVVSIQCLSSLDDRTDELDHLRQCNPMPTMPPFPAGAARFLQARKDRVRSVETNLRNPIPGSKQDPPLLKILDRLKNPDGEYDFVKHLSPRTRGNWHLGDVLIALETPDSVAVYTTDRHFQTHAVCLSTHLYRGFMPT